VPDPIIIRLPDIGDYRDVAIAEVLIAPGSTVVRDAPILVIETDKASMEVPSLFAGVVGEVIVRVGDRVSQGSPIASLRAADAFAEEASPPPPARDPEPRGKEIRCGLVVLGGGPGGYSAAFRAADLGLDVVLVERHERLGGVCLNVGCIPSKALLHMAGLIDEAKVASAHGLVFGAPRIDLPAVRRWKDGIVGTLTGGLTGMARARKVRVVRGTGRLAGPHALAVEGEDGATTVRFERCIVAAGSRPARLPFLPDDPRVVNSTGALALAAVPNRMLVIGGGIVGLEMATVYSSFGATVDVVEVADHLMPGADRDLVEVWRAANRDRFHRVMLGTRATSAEARPDGIWLHFEGADAPPASERYDLVLAAAGRTANGDRLDAERADLAVGRGGTIAVDRQMRTSVPHIFAIGDVAGAPMLAHKAVHEGHVAAEAAAGHAAAFDAIAIPSVAYTRPEIAWVGLTEASAAAEGRRVSVSRFPWTASGRALASDAAQGATKLLFDEATGRVVGGGIVGAHAGELIAEVALAIEMGADAPDLGRTIHPHPTLSETVGLSAEVEDGICTDLPPARRPRAGAGHRESQGARTAIA